MKIGINASFKKLHLIKETFKEYNIQHIQIALPANLDMISNDIYNMVSKYKIENPGIEISIHAYPFNFAESVEVVRNTWIELAHKTIDFANNIEAVFVNFHCGYGIDILRKFYYRLGSIHAHDNDQLADIHWPIGNGDLGSIKWDEEIKFLNSINYKGAFILEGYPNDQLESLKYLKKLNLEG